MNLLSGSTSDLFPTSSGAVTFTKGMYIPNKVFTLPEFSAMDGEPTVDSPDPNIKITFIDTEGQGALVSNSYDEDAFVLLNWLGRCLRHEPVQPCSSLFENYHLQSHWSTPDTRDPHPTRNDDSSCSTPYHKASGLFQWDKWYIFRASVWPPCHFVQSLPAQCNQ
jgi:hypothetical protein